MEGLGVGGGGGGAGLVGACWLRRGGGEQE